MGDLPDFLPWYKIPVPRAFFLSLFLARQQNNSTVYREKAYGLTAGDTFYDHKAGYGAIWRDALPQIGWCIQITSPKLVSFPEADGPLSFQILRPNKKRTRLEETESATTIRSRFVEFLKAGDMQSIAAAESLTDSHSGQTLLRGHSTGTAPAGPPPA